MSKPERDAPAVIGSDRCPRSGKTSRRAHSVTHYGVCIGPRNQNYCFNRDYLVMALQLPDELLESVKRKAVNIQDRLHGHGWLRECFAARCLAPGEFAFRLTGWRTYWLFNDRNAPPYKCDLPLTLVVNRFLQTPQLLNKGRR